MTLHHAVPNVRTTPSATSGTARASAATRRRRRRPAQGSGPKQAVTAARDRAREAAAAPVETPPARVGASFADLGVPAVLVGALAARGVTAPFPIQAATLPDTLAGRDVLGRGRTGSGKTLAFLLPVVSRLAASASADNRHPGRPRGLVLAPTRELVSQIAAAAAPLADAAGLRVTTVFGGLPIPRQAKALAGGIDLLIACPGRLEDLIARGHARLDAVEVTVLDEADHMADLGFLPAVRRLLNQTPPAGQRLLFSATLDNGVDILVRRYLHDPLTHAVDPPEAPVATMTHHVLAVASTSDKALVVRELAAGRGRRLLFTRTKRGAVNLARQLTAAGVPAVDLHGNLSQNARERNLAAFTRGEVRVLVATDIAARGIHVDGIDLVVHVDPPAEHKAYLHRSGRTARAGAGGDVVTVVLPEQRTDVQALTRKARISAVHHQVTAESPQIVALVGPRAEHVPPPAKAPAPAKAKASASRQAPASGRSTGGTRSAAPRSAGGPRPASAAPGRRRSAVDVSRAGTSRRGRRG